MMSPTATTSSAYCSRRAAPRFGSQGPWRRHWKCSRSGAPTCSSRTSGCIDHEDTQTVQGGCVVTVGGRADLRVPAFDLARGPWHEQRELDREDRALARSGTLRVDAPAVQLDDVAHDGQAEPEAPVGTGRRAVRLLEALEDARQELRPDALARVAHGDLDVRVEPFEHHLDAPALRRELDGIGEEIPRDLLQPLGVACDRTSFRVEDRLHPDVLR